MLIIQYYRNLMALKMDKRAVTAIEYALIAALIAVAIIAALSLLANNISSTFNYVGSKLSGAPESDLAIWVPVIATGTQADKAEYSLRYESDKNVEVVAIGGSLFGSEM